jgi:hypothetical protein
LDLSKILKEDVLKEFDQNNISIRYKDEKRVIKFKNFELRVSS